MTYPMWWLLPTLPETHSALVHSIIADESPKQSGENSSKYEVKTDRLIEAMQLISKVKEKLEVLQRCNSDDWLWQTELHFHAWTAEELQISTHYDLPPMKYEVALEIINRSNRQKVWSGLLVPAELKVITLLAADIGRRIGDELDGPKPD